MILRTCIFCWRNDVHPAHAEIVDVTKPETSPHCCHGCLVRGDDGDDKRAASCVVCERIVALTEMTHRPDLGESGMGGSFLCSDCAATEPTEPPADEEPNEEELEEQARSARELSDADDIREGETP